MSRYLRLGLKKRSSIMSDFNIVKEEIESIKSIV